MTPKTWILRGRCYGISTRHTVYGPWCFSFSKWCCVAHGWLLSLLIGEASSKNLLYLWVCFSTSDFWSKQNNVVKNDTLQLWRFCLCFLGAILRNLSELQDCGTVSMGSGKINLTPQKSSVEKARFCGLAVCCSPLSPALYTKKIWALDVWSIFHAPKWRW